MIESNTYEYDDYPLAEEETTEFYYLDNKAFVGKMLPLEDAHETNIEKVMPENNIYESDLVDSDNFKWQITYQFSSNTRNPITSTGAQYGNYEMSFRRLYIILCEHFNNGQYFIDDYIKENFPVRLQDYVEARLKSTKEAYLALVNETKARKKKDGSLDMRYKSNKELAFLEQDSLQQETDEIAYMIKEDIKDCLATGIIPLKFELSSATMKTRKERGLPDIPAFYATGQLIDDLRIFFKLEKK
jgi:hypothetical protein